MLMHITFVAQKKDSRKSSGFSIVQTNRTIPDEDTVRVLAALVLAEDPDTQRISDEWHGIAQGLGDMLDGDRDASQRIRDLQVQRRREAEESRAAANREMYRALAAADALRWSIFLGNWEAFGWVVFMSEGLPEMFQRMRLGGGS